MEIEKKLLPAQMEYEHENEKKRKPEDNARAKKKNVLDTFTKVHKTSNISSRKQSLADHSDLQSHRKDSITAVFGGSGATKLKQLAGMARKVSKGSIHE